MWKWFALSGEDTILRLEKLHNNKVLDGGVRYWVRKSVKADCGSSNSRWERWTRFKWSRRVSYRRREVEDSCD